MSFRPMRRFKQQLPEEECAAILETAYRGFLFVIGDGGYPYAVPINYVYADGMLYFHCAAEGHKLDALRASDKACFTVIDTPEKEPDDLRGIEDSTVNKFPCAVNIDDRTTCRFSAL